MVGKVEGERETDRNRQRGGWESRGRERNRQKQTEVVGKVEGERETDRKKEGNKIK
jgi:hypothetical protein